MGENRKFVHLNLCVIIIIKEGQKNTDQKDQMRILLKEWHKGKIINGPQCMSILNALKVVKQVNLENLENQVTNERLSISMLLEWKFLKCLLKEIQQPKEISVL